MSRNVRIVGKSTANDDTPQSFHSRQDLKARDTFAREIESSWGRYGCEYHSDFPFIFLDGDGPW